MCHPRHLVVLLFVFLLVAAGAVITATGAFGRNSSRSAPVRESSAVKVGPGSATARLDVHGYQLDLRLSPNRALQANSLSLRLSSGGKPVSGARVRMTFTMLDMDMGALNGLLPQTASGRYGHAGPRLMFGDWGVRLHVRPQRGRPFSVYIVDRVGA